MRISDWSSDVCSSDLGAAEDDLDDGGVPDRASGVVAPLVSYLRERLEDGHRGDPGAAAFGHQHRQRRQRRQVANLIESQQQWWVETCAGRLGREAACGLDEVFDERGDQ